MDIISWVIFLKREYVCIVRFLCEWFLLCIVSNP